MGKRKKSLRNLSQLENVVMHIVWKLEQASAEDVRLALPAKHELKDSTVRTLLRRLEDKGFLQHSVDGRTYKYYPVIGPRDLAGSEVQGIADRFCQGSVSSLLLGMADDSLISPAELRRLADQIEKAQEKKERSTAGNKPASKSKNNKR